MARRVFVLASNSFAGGHFIDHALNQGAQVLGTSRSEEYADSLLAYTRNPRRREAMRFVRVDINRDFERLTALIQDFRPDWILDFAGQGMVAQSWNQPEQWFQTNLMAKVRLHEFLRQQSFLKVYLRFSTPEVYGHSENTLNEQACLRPSTPYAVSHAAIDMSLLAYHRQYNFPVILTRASNIYGPFQQLYRIIPRAIIYGKTGRRLKLDGGGSTIRNFVFMPEVSDALWRLCDSPAFGQVFHLASDEYVSIKDLVERIAASIGIPMDQLAEVGPERPGKDKAYILDVAKIKDEYGWTSKVSLEEGISRTREWIDVHLQDLLKTPLDYIHKE